MKCPKCSGEAVSCPVAYEQGTSRSESSGSIDMTVSGGQYQSYGGTQTTTTVTRTAFAERAAPPSPMIKGALAGILFFGIAAALFDGGWSVACGIVAALFVAFLAWRLISLPSYFRERKNWEASWICGACGNIFVP